MIEGRAKSGNNEAVAASAHTHTLGVPGNTCVCVFSLYVITSASSLLGRFAAF